MKNKKFRKLSISFVNSIIENKHDWPEARTCPHMRAFSVSLMPLLLLSHCFLLLYVFCFLLPRFFWNLRTILILLVGCFRLSPEHTLELAYWASLYLQGSHSFHVLLRPWYKVLLFNNIWNCYSPNSTLLHWEVDERYYEVNTGCKIWTDTNS